MSHVPTAKYPSLPLARKGTLWSNVCTSGSLPTPLYPAPLYALEAALKGLRYGVQDLLRRAPPPLRVLRRSFQQPSEDRRAGDVEPVQERRDLGREPFPGLGHGAVRVEGLFLRPPRSIEVRLDGRPQRMVLGLGPQRDGGQRRRRA